MKNNKSKKVFILLVIVIVLILVVGVAYAMLATNMFKSYKELFFEYSAQIFDEENGFIDNKLVQYNEKKQNSAYEHQGNIIVNSSDSTISFAGNIDTPNNKVEELVKLNYSNSVNFPIMYKKIDTTHALKFEDISKRYFGINEDEIAQLIFGQTGLSNSLYGTSSNYAVTNNMVDFTNITLSQNEKEKLQNTYVNVISDSLENSNFTKITTTDGEGYSLEISSEKQKEIIVKLLETLKDDDTMLEKINSIFSAYGIEITSQNIEYYIESINQTETQEGSIIITVYESKGKLNKIEIQFNDEYKVTIEKTSSDNGVAYDINIQNQITSITFNASYVGLQTLEEITENYELAYNADIAYTYNVENTVNFTNSNIEINDFEKNEYIDFASLSQEKASKLLETIAKGIIQVNTEKMEEAGIKGENPFIAMVPGLSEGIALYNSAVDVIEGTNQTIESEENKETTTSETEQEEEDATSSDAEQEDKVTSSSNTEQEDEDTTATETIQEEETTSLVDGMEKLSKETYNAKFTQYEGDNVRGAVVKSLIMQIIANNMIDDGRKISVTGDITLTGNEVPDSVETSKFYKVKCSTDLEGYISKVDIKTK